VKFNICIVDMSAWLWKQDIAILQNMRFNKTIIYRLVFVCSARRHKACLARYMLSPVRLSHGCIIEKRLKLGLWNFYHTVSPSPSYCGVSFIQKI